MSKRPGILLIVAAVGLPLPALRLALLDQRVHGSHLHVEQRLDSRLDLRLRSGLGHFENQLVMFADQRRLLGDDCLLYTSRCV